MVLPYRGQVGRGGEIIEEWDEWGYPLGLALRRPPGERKKVWELKNNLLK